MNLKLFPCLILIIQFECMNFQLNTVKCDDKSKVQMDRALTKLLVVGQKGVKFPTNSQGLRQYCNLALKTYDMVSKYNEKCLPPFGRDAARVFMHSINNELKAVCKTGRLTKRAKELLEAAPCANAGLSNWQRCNQQLINKFTGVLNSPVKKRIPMGCCNFHQLIQCLTEEAEEVKRCTKKTIDFVIKYVNKLIDPMIVILCNEYSQPSDKCDQIVRLTPNRTASQPVFKSFFIPLIDIAMSLEEEEPLQ